MPRSAPPIPTKVAILLPPSEGKAAGGGRPAWKVSSGRFGSSLSRARTQIVEALGSAGGGTSAVLGVSGVHLERAREINSSLVGSATLPAWQRYTGVVWDHIDPATLSDAAFDRARDAVVVLSGLLGLVGFDDPIPDYKLKIGSSLELPTAHNGLARQKLSAYWHPQVSRVLDGWLTGRTVIDLLPLEHRRAWTPAAGTVVLRATFIDARGRSVGHDAKAAKGSFVRHLLTARSPIRAIESWSHPDYSIDITRVDT